MFVTTELAATIQPDPILEPSKNTAPAPIQQLFPNREIPLSIDTLFSN